MVIFHSFSSAWWIFQTRCGIVCLPEGHVKAMTDFTDWSNYVLCKSRGPIIIYLFSRAWNYKPLLVFINHWYFKTHLWNSKSQKKLPYNKPPFSTTIKAQFLTTINAIVFPYVFHHKPLRIGTRQLLSDPTLQQPQCSLGDATLGLPRRWAKVTRNWNTF